ncbi:unnamed protein product [Ceratitis capitata]|uniref:(Mediterranean fruit fly) hypothetical protein n=1 Tax=Ceratitis capitata TaxID=7213 RepID=A0A811VAH8_CERCA|nr:unnamed protein product [Ceratitis capitata]
MLINTKEAKKKSSASKQVVNHGSGRKVDGQMEETSKYPHNNNNINNSNNNNNKEQQAVIVEVATCSRHRCYGNNNLSTWTFHRVVEISAIAVVVVAVAAVNIFQLMLRCAILLKKITIRRWN